MSKYVHQIFMKLAYSIPSLGRVSLLVISAIAWFLGVDYKSARGV